MDIQTAKTQLNNFLGDSELTFCINEYENGEWSAQCNEIAAIATCGKEYDIYKIDFMIKDAILTAAGVHVEPEQVAEIIKFRGLRPISNNTVSNFFKKSDFINQKANYELRP